MVPIFTAPTTHVGQRTLMASSENWRKVMPRLSSDLIRRIEQQLQRNRDQPMIRIDVSQAEAVTVLNEAQKIS